MKRVLKWGSSLLTIILGVVMVITMYCAISSRINGGTPSIFGMQMYEVLSGSMEPKVHTGSVIFDHHVDTKNLKVGDVITFTVPHEMGMVVTHRIVNVSTADGQMVFETKGDANATKDTWQIPAKSVIGQYSNITVPYLGYYLNFLKTKLGISIMMLLPGALLIILSLTSMFREILRLQKGNGTPKAADSNTSNADAKA